MPFLHYFFEAGWLVSLIVISVYIFFPTVIVYLDLFLFYRILGVKHYRKEDCLLSVIVLSWAVDLSFSVNSCAFNFWQEMGRNCM